MPRENGVYIDSKAAYDYLIKNLKVDFGKLILYGESLGVAVAVDLASRRKVSGLILEGGFSSGRDIGKMIYPYFPRIFIPDVFNSLKKIDTVAAPKLFIHSLDDQVVPFRLGRRLYDAASEPKEFVEITGFHDGGFLDSEEKYISAIRNFIDNLK